jgi:hypothetical protein
MLAVEWVCAYKACETLGVNETHYEVGLMLYFGKALPSLFLLFNFLHVFAFFYKTPRQRWFSIVIGYWLEVQGAYKLSEDFVTP